MFSGTFDIWHWLIVLAIVIAIFGTKKLAGAGTDLGAAVRNFKKSMKDGEAEADAKKEAEALAADAEGKTEFKADPPAAQAEASTTSSASSHASDTPRS